MAQAAGSEEEHSLVPWHLDPISSAHAKSFDHDLRGLPGTAFFKACFHLRGNLPVDPGIGAVRIGRNNREAPVGLLANGKIERYFAKERHVIFRRFRAGAAMREYVRPPAAMRAQEIAHVFHNANTGTSTFRNMAMPRRANKGELWRRHNEPAPGGRNFLRQAAWAPPGAGRNITNKKLAPPPPHP